ncbi:MAG: bifunctional adenosylcobinamide kinase/adenosylcobinamide-phosphate guanylyltransferase [Gammaproteobacteria bacterium]|nr:MAG: bifunctional adenosylcobinamide kinase/adenosylcobinamide-phosphate guanylyltransferase [Gammaproteobacteria bacterium]
MSVSLIIGGARSGKSRYAEELASQDGEAVCYVATALAFDKEMEERILHHQARRPAQWTLHECPLALPQLLSVEAKKEQTILVDCLTMWVNNQIYENPTQDFSQLFLSLSDSVVDAKAHVIFVANEVGLGIIPLGEITRQFVDEAGRLNQQIAKLADKVRFMVAGLPLALK